MLIFLPPPFTILTLSLSRPSTLSFTIPTLTFKNQFYQQAWLLMDLWCMEPSTLQTVREPSTSVKMRLKWKSRWLISGRWRRRRGCWRNHGRRRQRDCSDVLFSRRLQSILFQKSILISPYNSLKTLIISPNSFDFNQVYSISLVSYSILHPLAMGFQLFLT